MGALGQFVSEGCMQCDAFSSACSCVSFPLQFPGDLLYDMMPVTDNDVPADLEDDGWFNSTFQIPSQMWAEREERQAAYNISWAAADMDAAWLGNRIMMYPYILQVSNSTRAELFIDGERVPMTPSYNSRGHIVERCFQGFYFNATSLVEGSSQSAGCAKHTLSFRASLNSSAGQRLVWI